jgi:uncharacterized damage-inducible protein DinB
MPLSPSLLRELESELPSLRRCLERLPADKFDYQPHPKSMTLGQLATHLAQMPEWGATTINTTELDFSGGFEQPKPQTTDELLALFDSGAAAFREALAKASDEDFAQTWTLKGAEGKVFFAMPRTAVLRDMVMNHLAHHRGQLTVYMRMLDIPVPSIYGPSADEAV